jgi:TonB-linked SusC/RagA family outer membrane protein
MRRATVPRRPRPGRSRDDSSPTAQLAMPCVVMFSRRALVVALAAALGSGTALAQANQVRLTGKITDRESGQPIPFAQIQIVGTNLGTQTNQQGVYLVRGLPAGGHTVRAIALGYQSTQQSVNLTASQETTLDFALAKVAFQLEAIVTTATGQQLTRELGNSIAKIETAKLVRDQPITAMQDVLNGRTAGVTLIQSNGTVGGGSRVRIRGISSASLSNDPMVIVDGVRVEQGSPAINPTTVGQTGIGGGRPSFLNNLNPEEIENIDIVKGPSAATLYGTQSANGVIVITTKRGKAGTARWDLFAAQGVSVDPYDYPGQYYNLGRTPAGTTIDCLSWREVQGLCTLEQRYSRNLLEDESTTPFGTGHRQQYGAQVSGGSDQLRYFFSGTWENEIGVLKMPESELDSLLRIRNTTSIPRDQRLPNQLTRTGLRGNFNVALNPQADLVLASGFNKMSNLLPQTGDNLQGVIGSALFGTANPAATNVWGFAPPRQGFSKEVTRTQHQFTNSANANWRPVSWIQTRATVGLDYILWTDDARVRAGEGCQICGIEWQGLRGINKYDNSKYSADLGATANRNLTGSLTSKTSIGAQWGRDNRAVTFNDARILPPGGSTLDAGAQKQSSEQTVQAVTLGMYFEQQFGWRDQLFVTGAVRRDENSSFGADFGAAVYPKATVSWVAADNNAARWLNNLRLRGAFGESGQQPDVNAAFTFVAPVTATVLSGGVPAVTFGAFGGRLGNTKLKPERSREFEVGFDVSTLRSRISLQTTYYHKRTRDAIVQRDLAPSQTAGVNVFDNVGVVTNKGLEVSLNARLLDFTALRYDAQVEASWNKNRLESLAPGVSPFGGFGYRNEPGQPLFAAYWPTMTGYSDANNNGVIEPNEVQVTTTSMFGGSTVPTRTISLHNTIGLLNDRLRLSGLVDYRGGFTTHEVSTGFACGLGPNNCRAIHDPTAPLLDQARAVAVGRALGAYWQKGDFVRVREISAAFDLPRALVGAARARSANLVFSARNMGIWTKEFTGWDPEILTTGTDATPYNFVQQGQPRTFLLRLNLGY